MSGRFCFAIDRGGTFTDIYALCPGGKIRVMKLLSVDPANYDDAPREGIRRILEEETGVKHPPQEKIDGSRIEWVRMGTTVATNALLERNGERMALVTTKGFKDLLFIGNQARPKIFDLEIRTPEVLYEEVVEVDCRVVHSMTGTCKLPNSWKVVAGTTGENLSIVKEIHAESVRRELTALKKKGINSIAVVFMHSYMYPEHERQIGAVARECGIESVSLSHEVMPMIRIVNRGFTACADAYLTPHIQKYVEGFAAGFKDDLKGVNVLFMQSDGGLTPMELFNGSRAVLSGPAGGVVGYAMTTPGDKPVIGFDMGGTSTDVSRYAGSYEHVFESVTAGVMIQAPQLDINTVAAGGGSRLFFRSGLFVVGPESAGAHPGPVCYRKGGFLTVTDANLVLGRLIPEYFPKIFGPDEKQPLDKEASLREFEALTAEINAAFKSQGIQKRPMTIQEVAIGFIRVANETMCRPIRSLTQSKGYDTRNHILACFGGAGGQHACAIARELGMSQVAVHKYAGILSAYGMACADVVQEVQEPCSLSYTKENFKHLEDRISTLTRHCVEKLKEQGFNDSTIDTKPYLHLRYIKTDGSLMCSPLERGGPDSTKFGDFKASFSARYQNEFGFVLPNEILVDDIRVRGVGKIVHVAEAVQPSTVGDPPVDKVVNVYFEEGFLDTNVYLSKNLKSGHVLSGPAVIIDGLSTIIVEPNCEAKVTGTGDILIEVGGISAKAISTEMDPVQLSIFSHRFMSIAEQMGRVLQRTAISTNIKERLDFSCALFGPDGGLVSNAPHIPVHLGSMQDAVQFQMSTVGEDLKEGDVLLTNHPKAGGSHLPDLTVITPVFYKKSAKPVFFVASRGHHADIGGITPGSMPPHSKSLSEEGAAFKSFFLVRQGEFAENDLIKELMKPGEVPGSSGTRNLKDNIADLKAQIAANQKGIKLVQELIDFYGLHVIHAYMSHIQNNAEVAVKDMLRSIGKKAMETTGSHILVAADKMDDGSPISLKVTINVNEGTAVCDFSGSGHEVWGNCNAPRAITLSALIYCLRCMVGQDVPLNQGCLKPIEVVIPKNSLLDPSEGAAVVGGNVLTSQRVVDVVFKAFKACAASQGCMNNVTFGQKDWGYYETVAGGAGAGPTWSGRSGVHTHMTNTRITDPEILEKRFPAILQNFSLREGSGGNGAYKGGDGVIRTILFRDHLDLSILTERRVFQPYGLEGGEPGLCGVNLLTRADGRVIYLGSKAIVDIHPGDIFELNTPGGGGWGKAS